MRIVITALLLLGLSACSAVPRISKPSFEPAEPLPKVVVQPTGGAIYAAGGDVRLFEDLKAGRVGDILTVRLSEQTNASKNSQTSTSKSTESALINPTVLGREITKNGVPLFGGTLSGDQSFDGAGSSSQSNSLSGDITVTIVEKLRNGNLRIRGEKWVTLNQGREFIQLSGIIRPNDIEPDNTVLSNRIADAEIAYSSKGVMAAANRMGLISRFFHSILSPY